MQSRKLDLTGSELQVFYCFKKMLFWADFEPKLERSGEPKCILVTSMLVTDVGDQMCW